MYCCRPLWTQHSMLVLFILAVVLFCIISFPVFYSYSDGQTFQIESSSNAASVPDGNADNLIWFLQCTDMHISKFNPESTVNFEAFVNETVGLTNPSFVVNSGDITDGYEDNPTLFNFHGKQNEEEWQTYKDILVRNGYFNASFWHDLRGNHDTYGTSLDESKDFYHTYSVISTSGIPLEDRAYSLVINTTFGNYQVVNVDLAELPGLTTPFMYWGRPLKDALNNLERYLKMGVDNNYNATLVVTHYTKTTTAFIDSEKSDSGRTWERLMSDYEVTAQLDGHIHGRDMYMRSPDNDLELELLDLKKNRFFRIGSYDNDMFSVSDMEIQQYPHIHPTNPKDARFLAKSDQIERLAQSTHIRVLLFAPSGIQTVTAETISNSGQRTTYVLTLATGGDSVTYPLYVAPWNASQFGAGLHNMMIDATDVDGNNLQKSYQFSLDATSQDLGLNRVQFGGYFHTEYVVVPWLVVMIIFNFFFLLLLPKILKLSLKPNKDQKFWKSGNLKEEWDRNSNCWSSFKESMCFVHARTAVTKDLFCCVVDFDLETGEKSQRSCLFRFWRFLSWHGHTSLSHYANMDMTLWIGNAVIAFWFCFFPVIFGPLVNGQWTTLFWWGLVNSKIAHYDIAANMIALAFMIVIYLPLMAISVMKKQPNEPCRARHHSPWFIWNCIVLFIGYILFFIGFASIVPWYCLFLAPVYFYTIFWVIFVIIVVVRSHQKEVGESVDHLKKTQSEGFDSSGLSTAPNGPVQE